MDINLTPRDRARLYNLAEDHENIDPVEVILLKSRMYDEAHTLIKTAHPKLIDEEGTEPELLAMVKGLLLTLQQAADRDVMHHKNTARLDDQLRRLVKVCEENGMDLGLSNDLLRWKNKK